MDKIKSSTKMILIAVLILSIFDIVSAILWGVNNGNVTLTAYITGLFTAGIIINEMDKLK
jgi:hypothetical protein